MSSADDRDLAAAFETLTAPPSTADYATRTSGHDIRTTAARWPQALAGTLAVLVAVGGAGTFLALRSARQGGGPAATVGNPPARSGAAMAYDSTAGMTVMFGGMDASGKALADTWTWNGSAWSSAGTGPRPLAGVRMVDDPADGGVLLVGAPAPPQSGGGSSGSGCVVGTVTGTTSASAPATRAPGINPVRPTGPPLGDPLPSAPPPAPVPTCSPAPPPPTLPPAPAEQTWLFTSAGWSRVASGASATPPPVGSEMAFDPTTQQVVAVAPAGFSCGPPLEGAVSSGGADIACPAIGADSALAPGIAAGVPCSKTTGCPFQVGLSAWTWSRGEWQKQPADATVSQAGVTLLFTDPGTNHATLMTQFGLGISGKLLAPTCAPVQTCPAPAAPLVTTWTWTGSAWKKLSQLQNIQQGPGLSGATVAAVGGHLVVLTTTGETWTWAAGQWTEDTANPPITHPSFRFGAAMAEGPSGTVVLFGGQAAGGFVAIPPGGQLASDTWVWNGSSWRHAAGRSPLPPVTPPTCPVQQNGVIPPCAPVPQPVEVSPGGPGAPLRTPTPSRSP